jgi:hypothetical protein
MATYPFTLKKFQNLADVSPQPLEPGGVHGGLSLCNLTCVSESDITIVRCRYRLVFTGTLHLPSSGISPFGYQWWNDVDPMVRMTYRTEAGSPYPNPWPGGPINTDAKGLDAGFLSLSGGPPVASGSAGTQTALWNIEGDSHGATRLPGPSAAQAAFTLGWNFNSFAAQATASEGVIEWAWQGFAEAFFGSASPLS